MTRRMWVWTAVLTVVGGAMLAVTIRALHTWRPPAGSVAVLTLNQLLGFVISTLLLISALLVLLTGIRRRRDRLMLHRLARDLSADG